MSLPQCKCSELDDCMKEKHEKMTKCKAEPMCTKYLEEIGDAVKIKACLDKEHEQMLKLEECVKEKVGGMGCTNDKEPKMLSVPIIPPLRPNEQPPPPAVPSEEEEEGAEQITDTENNGPARQKREAVGSGAVPSGEEVPVEAGDGVPGPHQLAQYLMCVDKCAMPPQLRHIISPQHAERRVKRSPLNCVMKLQCALAPPTDKVQTAFEECEKELAVNSEERFQESCECMKAAGMQGVNCQAPNL